MDKSGRERRNVRGRARANRLASRRPFDVVVLETDANDMLHGVDPTATERNIQEIVGRIRANRPDVPICLRACSRCEDRYEERYRNVPPERRIVGFHVDEQGDWVAQLECGHNQHMRHNPPWISRPWVVSPEGRAAAIGRTLRCPKCDHRAPPDPRPPRC